MSSPDDRDTAKAALRDLAERGRARDSRSTTKPPPLSSEQLARDPEVRLRRTISMWGGARWWIVLIVLAVPTPALIDVVGREVSSTVGYSLPAVMLGCSFAIAGLARLYTDWKVRREHAWVRALPYELVGYPRLLGVKPREDETYLELRLAFIDGPPADLAAILHGFDPELVEGADCYVRERPAEVGKLLPYDLNRRVRSWVHRLVAEVLAPLHAAHRLRSVDVRLVVADRESPEV